MVYYVHMISTRNPEPYHGKTEDIIKLADRTDFRFIKSWLMFTKPQEGIKYTDLDKLAQMR